MDNVRLIMISLLLLNGMIFASQYQCLDVCIQVKSDQSFRKNSIPVQELEKYGRFGNIEALPFDQYFAVESAIYYDYLDSEQVVELKRNLLKDVPVMIKNNSNIVLGDNHSTVLRQYKFPKFLPHNFIKKVEACQNNNTPLQHVIYKQRSNGNTKTLSLCYWIGYAVKKEKSLKLLPVSIKHVPDEQYKAETQSYGEHIIDMLMFMSVLIFPITK